MMEENYAISENENFGVISIKSFQHSVADGRKNIKWNFIQRASSGKSVFANSLKKRFKRIWVRRYLIKVENV